MGGLIAMHGLGIHGAGTHEHVAHPGVAGVSAHSDAITRHAVHQSAMSAAQQASTGSSGDSPVSSPADSPLSGSMLALCLAILGEFLLAIAAALRSRRGGRRFAVCARALVPIVVAGRGGDRPCAVPFLVMRC
jgi:hypothetical protein